MLTTASFPLTPLATPPTGTATTATDAAEAAPFGPLLAGIQEQAAGARPGQGLEQWFAEAVSAGGEDETLPVEAGNGLPPAGESLPLLPVQSADEGAGQQDDRGEEQSGVDGLAVLFDGTEPAPSAAEPGQADIRLPGTAAAPLVTVTVPVTVAVAASTPGPGNAGGGGMTGRLLYSARAAAPDQAAAARPDDAAPATTRQGPAPAATGAPEPVAARDRDFAAAMQALERSGIDATGSDPLATAPLRESPAKQYQHLAGNTASTSVQVPVGKPGWSEAIVDKVMWFSAQQLSSAEIQLNPPELGPLQVRVSTHQDQTSVYFSSHHVAVRDALDQSLPRLREMLDSQGIQLLDVGVGEDGAARQQAHRGERGGSGGAAAGGEVADSGPADTAAHRVPVATTSLVDAYA